MVLGKVNPRDHHRPEDHERIEIQELDKNHSSILVQPLLSDLCGTPGAVLSVDYGQTRVQNHSCGYCC